MPQTVTPEPSWLEVQPAKVGPKVAIGATTLVGWTSSSAAFIAAAVALIAGDHTEATVGTVVAGVAGLVILAVTQAGRYLQSHAAIKSPGVAEVAGIAADELEAHKQELEDVVAQAIGRALARAQPANGAAQTTASPDRPQRVDEEPEAEETDPPDEVLERPTSATTPDPVKP